MCCLHVNNPDGMIIGKPIDVRDKHSLLRFHQPRHVLPLAACNALAEILPINNKPFSISGENAPEAAMI